MTIDFNGRVALVTGAGNGLGRGYALMLAERGAKVVVNDFGGSVDGTGGSSDAANRVRDEIVAAGGEALAITADVTNVDQVQAMVDQTVAEFGRVDILINNAGILRDRSFAKMSLEDFRFVLEVHLMGSVICSKAVWGHMREQNYGRILMTSSTSGLYGNFGQSNYSAAKLGLVGFMNSLRHEGGKNDIRVNTIVPMAATRLTEGLQPDEDVPMLDPAFVAPAALFLVSHDAPNGVMMTSGAGGYTNVQIVELSGQNLGLEATVEDVSAAWGNGIRNKSDEFAPSDIYDHGAGFQKLVRGD